MATSEYLFVLASLVLLARSVRAAILHWSRRTKYPPVAQAQVAVTAIVVGNLIAAGMVWMVTPGSFPFRLFGVPADAALGFGLGLVVYTFGFRPFFRDPWKGVTIGPWWWVVLALVTGVCEEFVWRGFAYARGRTLFGPAGGLLALTLFAVGHMGRGLPGLAGPALLGLVCSLLLDFRGSLGAPIIAHATYNFCIGWKRERNGTNTRSRSVQAVW
jgi:membrane protease YdiL (CAAX protease family)